MSPATPGWRSAFPAAAALRLFPSFRSAHRARRGKGLLRKPPVRLTLVLRRVVTRKSVVAQGECPVLPGFVIRPAEGERLDRSRRGQGGERIQRLEQDPPLQFGL